MKNVKIKSKKIDTRIRGYGILAYVKRQKKIIEITRERQYLRRMMPKVSKNTEKHESLDQGTRANPK